MGSNTGIHYSDDCQEYLTVLETGLRQRKKSVINIIKQWDDMIFPDTDSSLVKGKKNDRNTGLRKAMDLLEADSVAADSEEDEDEDEDEEGGGDEEDQGHQADDDGNGQDP